MRPGGNIERSRRQPPLTHPPKKKSKCEAHFTQNAPPQNHPYPPTAPPVTGGSCAGQHQTRASLDKTVRKSRVKTDRQISVARVCIPQMPPRIFLRFRQLRRIQPAQHQAHLVDQNPPCLTGSKASGVHSKPFSGLHHIRCRPPHRPPAQAAQGNAQTQPAYGKGRQGQQLRRVRSVMDETSKNVPPTGPATRAPPVMPRHIACDTAPPERPQGRETSSVA